MSPKLFKNGLCKRIANRDFMFVHKNHIANQIYHLAIVASREKISKDDMGRYGKVKELTLEELFGY